MVVFITAIALITDTARVIARLIRGMAPGIEAIGPVRIPVTGITSPLLGFITAGRTKPEWLRIGSFQTNNPALR